MKERKGIEFSARGAVETAKRERRKSGIESIDAGFKITEEGRPVDGVRTKSG